MKGVQNFSGDIDTDWIGSYKSNYHTSTTTTHDGHEALRELTLWNRIGGVMVSVFASSVVDREFEHESCQTKNYKIGVCCVSAYHASLKRKSKDWLP